MVSMIGVTVGQGAEIYLLVSITSCGTFGETPSIVVTFLIRGWTLTGKSTELSGLI